MTAHPGDGAPGSGWALWLRVVRARALRLLELARRRVRLRRPPAHPDYPTIRGPGRLRAGGTRAYREQPNRFVGYLTFALNYRLGGLETRGYHLANLAIHLVGALLVFALGLLAFRGAAGPPSAIAPMAPAVAFLAAALFVTHPLGTQAVSYVVQRFASLAACLYLALRGPLPPLAARLRDPVRAARRLLLYLGLLFSSLLAFRTKETSFTLPAALLLAETAPLRRPGLAPLPAGGPGRAPVARHPGDPAPRLEPPGNSHRQRRRPPGRGHPARHAALPD